MVTRMKAGYEECRECEFGMFLDRCDVATEVYCFRLDGRVNLVWTADGKCPFFRPASPLPVYILQGSNRLAIVKRDGKHGVRHPVFIAKGGPAASGDFRDVDAVQFCCPRCGEFLIAERWHDVVKARFWDGNTRDVGVEDCRGNPVDFLSPRYCSFCVVKMMEELGCKWLDARAFAYNVKPCNICKHAEFGDFVPYCGLEEKHVLAPGECKNNGYLYFESIFVEETGVTKKAGEKT